MTNDERAIRDLIQTWIEASQAGDLETLKRLMADDVIFMVPEREPFGKAEFAAASEKLKNVRLEVRSDIREIRVLGDWAYLRNHLEVAMTPPGVKEPTRRSGYVLSVLRKNPNGQWVIARDANLLT